jgi:hypothetical protein
MGGLEELELAECALVVEFLHVEELARVHDGLHHHVLESGLLLSSTIFLQSAIEVAMGTVQATCLPAFSASIDIQAWSGIGELMWTASTFGSLSRSLKSV